jgi:hypothetical protein
LWGKLPAWYAYKNEKTAAWNPKTTRRYVRRDEQRTECQIFKPPLNVLWRVRWNGQPYLIGQQRATA